MFEYFRNSTHSGTTIPVICLVLMIGLPGLPRAQADYTTWSDSVFHVLDTGKTLSSQERVELTDSVYRVSLRNNDACRTVKALVLRAIQLDNTGAADSALTLLLSARDSYSQECDSSILMALYAGMTNVFLSLGELDRVDSIARLALAEWNESWQDRSERYAIINNMAIAQAMSGDLETSTATFHKALREAQKEGNTEYIRRTSINLGSIKGMTEDLDSAYYFLSRAAKAAVNLPTDHVGLLINLANVDLRRGRFEQANAQLDSAKAVAEANEMTQALADVRHARALMYARSNNYESAYTHLDTFISLQAEILNEKRVKAVTEMMEKYQSEKKARQIQQLELEKLNARTARNRFMWVGIVVLLIAIGLYGRLHVVRRSRKAIQKEKEISEDLLLNILPASVAEELKSYGYTTAKHFRSATILFSDFKNFTSITEQMSASDLVEEINVCFKAFDAIVSESGIEKIKTIGDAYMAAAGITESDTATALDVVMAGLEMQRFVEQRKAEREAQGLPAFEMRVGIHSGPVVAGIVGVKKFQYDLWGDTVNIASRMETSGAVGRVNISEATYQLIQDDPVLQFIPRGMVHTKGKGDLKMYFAELADVTV